MAELGTLRIDIDANATKSIQELKDVAKNIQGVTKEMRNVAKAGDKAKFAKSAKDVGDLSKASKEAARNAREMSKAFESAVRAQNKSADATAKAKDNFRGFKGQISNTKAEIANLTRRFGAFAAILATIGTFKQAGAVFAELELNSTRAASILTSTGGDFDDTLKRIQGTSIKLASTTEFTARQMASSLQFLAQAGLDTEQALGALPRVVELASISGLDLSRSADIVTNVMSGLSLSVSDLADVNNRLVGTFTSSNTTLDSLGESIKFVGPQAASIGVDFTDLSAAIGLLGNTAIKGSQAGTSLRRALVSIVKPTAAGQAALDKLGVSIEDVQGGNLRRLIEKLDVAKQRLGSDTFNAEAIKAFRVQGALAIASITGQGIEAFDDLKASIDRAAETDIAGGLLARRMDTLDGKIQVVKSSWESFLAGLGDSAAIKSALTVAGAIITFFDSILFLQKRLLGDESVASPTIDLTSTRGIVNFRNEFNKDVDDAVKKRAEEQAALEKKKKILEELAKLGGEGSGGAEDPNKQKKLLELQRKRNEALRNYASTTDEIIESSFSAGATDEENALDSINRKYEKLEDTLYGTADAARIAASEVTGYVDVLERAREIEIEQERSKQLERKLQNIQKSAKNVKDVFDSISDFENTGGSFDAFDERIANAKNEANELATALRASFAREEISEQLRDQGLDRIEVALQLRIEGIEEAKETIEQLERVGKFIAPLGLGRVTDQLISNTNLETGAVDVSKAFENILIGTGADIWTAAIQFFVEEFQQVIDTFEPLQRSFQALNDVIDRTFSETFSSVVEILNQQFSFVAETFAFLAPVLDQIADIFERTLTALGPATAALTELSGAVLGLISSVLDVAAPAFELIGGVLSEVVGFVVEALLPFIDLLTVVNQVLQPFTDILFELVSVTALDGFLSLIKVLLSPIQGLAYGINLLVDSVYAAVNFFRGLLGVDEIRRPRNSRRVQEVREDFVNTRSNAGRAPDREKTELDGSAADRIRERFRQRQLDRLGLSDASFQSSNVPSGFRVDLERFNASSAASVQRRAEDTFATASDTLLVGAQALLDAVTSIQGPGEVAQSGAFDAARNSRLQSQVATGSRFSPQQIRV